MYLSFLIRLGSALSVYVSGFRRISLSYSSLSWRRKREFFDPQKKSTVPIQVDLLNAIILHSIASIALQNKGGRIYFFLLTPRIVKSLGRRIRSPNLRAHRKGCPCPNRQFGMFLSSSCNESLFANRIGIFHVFSREPVTDHNESKERYV